MARADRGVATLLIIFLVAVVLAGLIAVIAARQHAAANRPVVATAARAPLQPEARAYLSSLAVSSLHMSAADNFLGHTVTYLDGVLTNSGQRPVRKAELQLDFVDTLNQVVLRETARPLADRTSPLRPGEAYPFRVTFEHLPADWNQAPPAVKPVYLEF